MNKDNSQERLLDIIGEVDDKYITEAAPTGVSVLLDEMKETDTVIEDKRFIINKSRFNKFLTVAAGILLVAAGALTVYSLQPDIAQQSDEKSKPEVAPDYFGNERDTEGEWDTEDFEQTTADEIFLIPQWNDMDISEQYRELEYNLNIYGTCTKEVSAELVGNRVSEATMTGYDVYEDKFHYIKAIVYELKDIAIDYAAAIQFEGTESYYIYINTSYSPETLGEFIDTLKLEDNLSFGYIYHSYFDEDNNFRNERYSIADEEIIWDMLLSDRTLKNVYNQNQMYITEMSISVDMPLFGATRSLMLTEDGYLVTNFFDTGKAFYIGEERVRAFIDYVMENCHKVTVEEEPTGEQITSHDMIQDEEYTEEVTSSALSTGKEGHVYEDETGKISHGYNPNE